MLPSFARFEFDLTKAIEMQVVATFESLTIGSFSEEEITEVPNERGVYQILFAEQLMHLGRAVNSLRESLEMHRLSLLRDAAVDVVEYGFKCISVEGNWINYIDLASLAIRYHKDRLHNSNRSSTHQPDGANS